MVVVGRGGILLAGEERLEGCFLLWRAGEHQSHLVEALLQRHGACVVGRVRPLRMVICEHARLRGIDGLRQDVRRLRGQRGAGQDCQAKGSGE
jgi:hypothetical protein